MGFSRSPPQIFPFLLALRGYFQNFHASSQIGGLMLPHLQTFVEAQECHTIDPWSSSNIVTTEPCWMVLCQLEWIKIAGYSLRDKMGKFLVPFTLCSNTSVIHTLLMGHVGAIIDSCAEANLSHLVLLMVTEMKTVFHDF